MKIIILSGSHPRHLFVHQAVLASGAECAAVVMEREKVLPSIPKGLSQTDKQNFSLHFKKRYEVESKFFGDLAVDDVFQEIPVLRCLPETLNSQEVADFVAGFDADMAFIFGVDIIKSPLMGSLPNHKVNLHLGLSPWYRGSATLFWPFYFLQPQYAGATFHKIVPEADAGDVLHQCVPVLKKGDGIHDVGARTVLQAKQDLEQLLKKFFKEGWCYKKQKSTGRLFLTKDFEPVHLRSIYNLFDDKIVDLYLKGELGDAMPNLVNGLS